MPIFRIKKKIVYFAHVPKAGGTSVERALIRIAESVSFLNGKYLKNTQYPWLKTSPQHMDVAAFKALFSDEFFDFQFAMIRHPATRFMSAFNHHRDMRNLSRLEHPVKFLNKIRSFSIDDHYRFDNHFRKMIDMMPPNAHVYALENGLPEAISSVNRKIGLNCLEGEIGLRNRGHYANNQKGLKGMIKRYLQPQVEELREKLFSDVGKYYGEDYEKFGYEKYPVNSKTKPS